jgi:hypothetical protein
MTDRTDLIERLRDIIMHNMDARLEAADALEEDSKRIDYLEHVVDHLRARLGSSLEHADHLLKRHLKMEEALEKIIKKAKASGHEKIVKKAEAILEDYDD